MRILFVACVLRYLRCIHRRPKPPLSLLCCLESCSKNLIVICSFDILRLARISFMIIVRFPIIYQPKSSTGVVPCSIIERCFLDYLFQKMLFFHICFWCFCVLMEFRLWLYYVFQSLLSPNHSPVMLICFVAEMVHVFATNFTDAKHRFYEASIS